MNLQSVRPEANKTLRILHLEDSEDDHELVMLQLRRDGLRAELHRIDTLPAFEAALAERWDAIVSDHDLPGFTGLDALARLRETGLVIPFVIVSGQIGEAMAVDAMRSGASDYILKNNLARLAAALEHAIEAAQTRRARIRADEELARSRERVAELARHLQTSIELERTAIAREIHDDVGGSLTALKFDLAWIERRVRDDELLQRVQSAQDVLAHALEASQRIMHNLRPAVLDQGLVAALQWLCENFSRRTGVLSAFHSSPSQLPELPSGMPLVVYRTAQEALTNISKHAQARHVRVDLALSHGVLSLEVADDGRGITEGDLAKARSFGIRGLHERAATVGGWIELGSTAAGTTLILSVPLDGGAAGGLGGPGAAGAVGGDAADWG